MFFAALRFYRDINIHEKLYWYRSPFAVTDGERVFAPVGTHNRLQKAVVERALEADEAHAPYDIALIKDIVGRCETRSFPLGGGVCTDLGGIRYDDRHYTRYDRIFVLSGRAGKKETEKARALGFDEILNTDAKCDGGAVADGKKILLAGDRAERFARNILIAARGGKTEDIFIKLADKVI